MSARTPFGSIQTEMPLHELEKQTQQIYRNHVQTNPKPISFQLNMHYII